MDWLIDPFSPSFMQRALLAGALVAAQCALIGVWIVLRRLNFLGDALAHGVIPGVAIAFLLGIDITLGAAVAAAVVVVGVTAIRQRTGLPEDTSIGLLFVGLLALGVIIISRSGSFAVDLTSFLFGNILGVTWTDISVQAIAVVISLGVTFALYRGLIALSFDERKAQLLGLWPSLVRLALLGLIALTVVTSFKSVGALLVFGLVVAPAATATLIATRIPMVMAVSAVLGVIAVVVGLLLSFHLDIAAGASMVATSVSIFFLVWISRETAAWWRLRRSSFDTNATASGV
jgi:ABC-type Mn2+/Zn2+ transport system permease subunit